MQYDSSNSLVHGRLHSFILFIAALLLLTSCSSNVPRTSTSSTTGGGYYLNDGPERNPPSNLDQVADAVPRVEPLKKSTMRPYTALGKTYRPMQTLQAYNARGQASWYGKRYHGRQTASGEVYDMYAMTAAHPTLPIPSYARVTNLQNGKSVVVRINDRGPFLANRLIDLSYVAAYKLGVLANGSAPVQVTTIIPGKTKVASSQAIPSRSVTQSALSGSKTKYRTQNIYLQLAAFRSARNAHSYLAQFKSDFPTLLHPSRVDTSEGLYKVLIGPFADSATASRTADILVGSGTAKPMLIHYSRAD